MNTNYDEVHSANTLNKQLENLERKLNRAESQHQSLKRTITFTGEYISTIGGSGTIGGGILLSFTMPPLGIALITAGVISSVVGGIFLTKDSIKEHKINLILRRYPSLDYNQALQIVNKGHIIVVESNKHFRYTINDRQQIS